MIRLPVRSYSYFNLEFGPGKVLAFAPKLACSKRGARRRASSILLRVISRPTLLFIFCTFHCSVFESLLTFLLCPTSIVLLFSLSLFFLFFFLSLLFPFSCPFHLPARPPFDHFKLFGELLPQSPEMFLFHH